MTGITDAQLYNAVATRFYAVNGVHSMTPEDDAYATEWYVPLEVLAETAGMQASKLRRLMLENAKTASGQIVSKSFLVNVRRPQIAGDGAPLIPMVRGSRIALLSDRSFAAYETALASFGAAKLPVDTDLFWDQGFFDVELEYPLRTADTHLSIRLNVAPELERRVKLRLTYEMEGRALQPPGSHASTEG